MFDATQRKTIALVVVLVLSLPAMAAPTGADEDSTDRDIVTIDNSHDLATDAAIDDYRSDGVVSTDLSQLEGTLTVAESKADVDADDELLPTDTRNHYLRLEYEEDFARTLRIHVPREYITPYSQAAVPSVTSDHHADFEPVRGGEYLEVVVHVDEPTDIVLPLQRDSAIGYRAVERLDRNIERATGYSAFSGDEWQYIDGTDLDGNATLELEDVDDPDEMVVQYDAHKDDPDETWLNAPDSPDDDIGVHAMTRTNSSGENNTAYVVATTSDPPDVRYKPNANPTDAASGWVNDAREIPSRIADGIGSITDIIPLSSEVVR